jgi:hypothetical protein
VHNRRLFDKSVIGLPPNTAQTTAHYVVGARFCGWEPILEMPWSLLAQTAVSDFTPPYSSLEQLHLTGA